MNQTVVCSASIWDLEIIVVASLVRHPHFILKFRIYFCVSGLYCFRVSFLDSLKENIRKEILLLQSCAPILYQGTYKPTAVIFKQISWSKSFRHSLARSISMRQELCICKERTHWLGISLWRHHASFLLSFFMSASVAPSLFLSLSPSHMVSRTLLIPAFLWILCLKYLQTELLKNFEVLSRLSGMCPRVTFYTYQWVLFIHVFDSPWVGLEDPFSISWMWPKIHPGDLLSCAEATCIGLP